MDAIPIHRLDDLLAAGSSGRSVTAALASGTLVRVRPGYYARGDSWAAAKPEARILARANALMQASTTRPIFSHETAAARHGLPLLRAAQDRVHVIVAPERPGAAVGVVRHRGVLDREDVVEVDGMLCTSLERTVADISRTAAFEQSVTVADAALRRVAVPRNGTYLADRAAQFVESARAIAARSAHGKTRAMRALEFADGRAQLPGESVSRVRLYELRFRDVDLQVHVAGPRNSDYYVDFGLVAERAFGEFDGQIKYVDGRLVDGRTSAEVFDREKQREDWIRGTTQWRYVRWGWPHVRTPAALAERLAAFGIRPSE